MTPEPQVKVDNNIMTIDLMDVSIYSLKKHEECLIGDDVPGGTAPFMNIDVYSELLVHSNPGIGMAIGIKGDDNIIKPWYYRDDPTMIQNFTRCREILISKICMELEQCTKQMDIIMKEKTVPIIISTTKNIANENASKIDKALNEVEKKAGWELTTTQMPNILNMPKRISDYKVKFFLVNMDTRYLSHPALLSLILGFYLKNVFYGEGIYNKNVILDNIITIETMTASLIRKSKYNTMVKDLIIHYEKIFKGRTIRENYENCATKYTRKQKTSIYGLYMWCISGGGVDNFTCGAMDANIFDKFVNISEEAKKLKEQREKWLKELKSNDVY